jgi:regulator of sigma E protease
MGASLINIIISLLALSVLVIVHEGGHFIAARLCGVKVEAFAVGFGKPLFKYIKNEIEYRLNWIPFGGYVRMKGDNMEADAPTDEDSFIYTKWWKKAIIAFSGPFANLLFGLVIFILAFMMPNQSEDQYPVVGDVKGEWSGVLIPGDSVLAINNTSINGWYQFVSKLDAAKPNEIKLDRMGHKITLTIPQVKPDSFGTYVLPHVAAQVGEVSPGMPAWRAGLQAGDLILAVDGKAVKDWTEMRENITASSKDTVQLSIRRGKITFLKTMALEANPLSNKQRLIGITQAMPVTNKLTYTPPEALKYGFNSTVNFVVINYVGLYKMFSQPEQLKNSVGGPVMMMTMSNQSAKKGFSNWIMFIGAISLILMVMNLLPIPVLDGGHIIFAFIQAIMGKPLPRKAQIVLQNIGMAIIFALMLYAFYSDFTKVFSRAINSAGRP